VKFLPSHGSPYIIVRYKQNSNHYNKVMNDNIINNQWQSITVNMFFINGLFMLNKFKKETYNSSDFHYINFEILDIDGNIIKFLSPFHVKIKFI
jgi:hypothetical protein